MRTKVFATSSRMDSTLVALGSSTIVTYQASFPPSTTSGYTLRERIKDLSQRILPVSLKISKPLVH